MCDTDTQKIDYSQPTVTTKGGNTIYICLLQFVGAISHEICNESRLNDVNIFSQLNEVTPSSPPLWI